ncbi:hypothetical protein AwWohl_13460 [Gammaproteobacteria bacterium]|nr:hypothetical protein AwWohl_13460 [Gammaproteobacteria bacterium]
MIRKVLLNILFKPYLLSSFLCGSFFIASVSYADIYSYVDEYGVRHLTDQPSSKAKLVMRTPSFSNPDRVENVQQLLNQPRFSMKSTMEKKFDVFQGNYPEPLSLRLKTLAQTVAYGQVISPQPQRNLWRVNQQNQEIYKPYIELIAAQVSIDPALIHAIISAESAFHIKARSHVGAMGLMQLMPATAKRFGVTDAYDPLQNIRGGATYLRWLLDRFGSVTLAAAGYNAGEGAVEKYNRQIPPYKETQGYVPKVLGFYEKYSREMYGRGPLHK